jgi:glycosyltransferase involved in cell wall biosynthesis
MTSDSEGMPNVVLEAMAEGAPVIATAVGGVPEVVRDGETGWLAAIGDADAIAEAMRGVLEAPAEAMRRAAAARQLVSRERTCAEMAQRLERAYFEALGEVSS